MKNVSGLALVIALSVTGCGGTGEPAATDAQESATQLENALSTQLDAVDKAESVEDTLQQQAEDRAKRMEEQGI